MSNYWDIWCRTCNVGLGLEVNHGESTLHELISASTGLADLPLFDGCFELRLLTAGSAAISIEWFREHRGHDLVPKDEYGRFSGQCGEPVICGECGSNQHCRLPSKHEGLHSFLVQPEFDPANVVRDYAPGWYIPDEELKAMLREERLDPYRLHHAGNDYRIALEDDAWQVRKFMKPVGALQKLSDAIRFADKRIARENRKA